MALKQGEIITLKISKLDLISLDSKAESLGMNRSEFIKYCINQEMERLKNEAEYKSRLNDFERLMQTLIDINNAVANSKQTTVKGIVQIQKALLEVFPNNKELMNIFSGEK